MSLPAQLGVKRYVVTDANQLVYAYNFLVLTNQELAVYIDGVVTANYTLSGLGDVAGGNVTFGTGYPVGTVILILRITALTQLLSLVSASLWDSSAMEAALNRAVMLVQDIHEILQRIPTLDKDSADTLRNMTLPHPGDTDSLMLGWNALKTALTLYEVDATNVVTSNLLLVASTYAGLPSPGTTGRLGWVTDTIPGLYGDAGSQWLRVARGYDVRLSGVVADGVTDDAAALTAAIATGAPILDLPAGTMRLASAITLPRNVLLRGVTPPGSTQHSYVSTVLHDFNGDCFTFTGADGSTLGTGGGIENLGIFQNNGAAGSANGNAVVVTGTSTALRGTWLRFHNLNIQEVAGKGQWTRGIYLNGAPIGAVLDNVRDIWISNSRINVDTGGTAAIALTKAENVHISDTLLNGAEGDLVITGDGASRSTQVWVTGGGGQALSLDFAASVTVAGSHWSSITDTANSQNTVVQGCRVTSQMVLLGTGRIEYWHATTGKGFMAQTNSTGLHIGRDLGAGDSTQQIALEVGNMGASEGSLILRYLNAAAAGQPLGDLRFFPRNNADSGIVASGAGVTFQKDAAADSITTTLFSTGGNISLDANGIVVPSKHIKNNGFASVASAGTIVLPQTSNIISVSGTTNIATITATGENGRMVILVFSGVLTVQDGAGNLLLNGDFVTSANDTLTLVGNGTNWFEVCRSAN